MKRSTLLLVATLLAAAPSAEADEEAPYGSLRVGPRLGGALGISGPRGGYFAGLEIRYDSPMYFTYALEAGFLHLLPQTRSVDETSSSDGQAVAPAHDVRVEGLYGVPVTLDVGLRLSVGPARLRGSVGFGAMFTTQVVDTSAGADREFIGSFCVRPSIGADLPVGNKGALVRLDLAYLWQQASFSQTGGDDDSDSVMITIGYSWLLYPKTPNDSNGS